ncbi:MAG: hypothetical protein ACRDB0_07055 [Paraclostridium sp.]
MKKLEIACIKIIEKKFEDLCFATNCENCYILNQTGDLKMDCLLTFYITARKHNSIFMCENLNIDEVEEIIETFNDYLVYDMKHLE